MNRLYNKLIDVAKVIGNLADKIAKLSLTDLMDSYFNVTSPMKCGLRVLVHADLWINNILYKLDAQGNAMDAKIIDFQMSFWGSPNADLIYLLFSSVMDDVKVKYFDDIIEWYYGELIECLWLLKYTESIPTVEDLKQDLMTHRMYGNNLNCFLLVIYIIFD